MDVPDQRGRRGVAADLNLVPYIDLLTCMISFLLITAVWTQLARLQVRQKAAAGQGSDEPPLMKVEVSVNEDGFNLIVGETSHPLPKRERAFDFAALEKQLRQIKGEHPDMTVALVTSEDTIRFEALAQTMDTLLTAGFPDLALAAP